MKKLAYSPLVSAVAVALTSRVDDKTDVLSTTEFPLEGIPAEIKDGDNIRSLAAYGLSSLLQDRTSGIKDPEERLEKMAEILDQLKAGIWRTVRASGERKATVKADLVEAVRRFFVKQGQDVSTEAVLAKLQAMSKEDRKAMAAHPAIKALRAIYNAELAKQAESEENGESVNIADLFASAGETEADAEPTAEA